MKNITIALPEEVALWTRISAAKNNSSVSKMLADMLRERMEKDLDYESAMKAYLNTGPVALKTGGRYPSRSDVHE